MASPSIVIDGAQPYGSRVLSIGGTPFIADEINIERPTTMAEDRLATGAPNRARWTADRITGTAILQAPSGSSGWPVLGQTFSGTFDDNFGSETFVITAVPYSESNDPSAVRKINITFGKVYNSITTVA